jgi:lipopolysaccharide heptosyltransferase II
MRNLGNIEKKSRKILIIKWGALGDIAMSTAIIEDIRNKFPNSEIDLNTMPKFEGFFQDDDRFNRVWSTDLRQQGKAFEKALSWIVNVKKNKYNLIIDLQNNDRSKIILSFLRLFSISSPIIVGQHQGFPYHIAPVKKDIKPRGNDGLKRMVSEIGIIPSNEIPVIRVSKGRISHVKKVLRESGILKNDFIILVPGSHASAHLKRWGDSKYANLANELWRSKKIRSCIVGGPDDIEVCQNVHNQSVEATVNLCGTTNILDLIPLGDHALAIIANDTGPAHVLAACNKPMISICGPTDPERVKPLGEKVQTIQADVECKSCYLKECPNKHVCMENIRVLDIINLLINAFIIKP